LDDLRKNGDQASWDWEADERFAHMIGDLEAADMIRQAIDSVSTIFHRYTAVHVTGITQKRLRALRRLGRQGFIKTGWIGTGPGGYNEFGVRRSRWYRLVGTK
jgi:hypothetical protein